MSTLTLGDNDAIAYEYIAPTTASGATFTFFNALTGDMNMWEATVGPALRAAGHGTLGWNYRGQAGSPVSADLSLDDRLISGDGGRLLAAVNPPRPLLVGLSIGGLFAARTALSGATPAAVGLVLINTLRRPGPRLAWINDAVLRCAEVGSLELIKDLYAPLLFNSDWLRDNRDASLQNQAYTPLASDQGHYRLLHDSRSADWDLPYESLKLPTLVVTGLQDRVFLQPEHVAEDSARLPRGQQIDIADAGHMVPVERPQKLAAALLDFAAGLA